MAKFIATRPGLLDGHYIRTGETFVYNGKGLPWAKKVASDQAVRPAAPPAASNGPAKVIGG